MYQAFLIWARCYKKLAFNTVVNACVNGLMLYLCQQGGDVDIDEMYNIRINGTLIMLLRAFGNKERVTEALLTSHFIEVSYYYLIIK